MSWIVLGALVAPLEVSASGLDAPAIGPAAGHPARAEGMMVWHNPAMLSFAPERQQLIGGALVAGTIRYTRERRAIYQREDSLNFAEPIDARDIDLSKRGFADASEANPLAPVPTGALVWPLAGGLTLGLGAYAPYAAIVDYGPGAQQWALKDATILTTYITPALSWRTLDDTFSVGVGFSYVLGYASLNRVQDFAALDDVGRALAGPPINQDNSFGASAPPSVRELSTMARPVSLEDAWAHGLTFHVGVAWRPHPDWTIGATYRHGAPMDFLGRFTLDMDDPFFTGDLESQGLRYPSQVRGDASLSINLPSSADVGVDWRIGERGGASVKAGWTRWSAVRSFDVRLSSAQLAQPMLGLPSTAQLRIERAWVDTMSLEVSGRFGLAQGWSGRASAGYQSSASPDETIDAASPDGDRLLASVGVVTQLSERWSLIADVGWQSILSRSVVGSRHDLGNGTYQLTLYTAGLYAGWTF
jgi:long-chain fatty acid transport protein